MGYSMGQGSENFFMDRSYSWKGLIQKIKNAERVNDLLELLGGIKVTPKQDIVDVPPREEMEVSSFLDYIMVKSEDRSFKGLLSPRQNLERISFLGHKNFYKALNPKHCNSGPSFFLGEIRSTTQIYLVFNLGISQTRREREEDELDEDNTISSNVLDEATWKETSLYFFELFCK